MKHYRIKVTGKVQGVFFRKYTAEEAERIGLKGIVRNERDGSVYIEAEEEPGKLEQFVQWCWKGSPSSKVESVSVEEGDLKSYRDFRIERTSP
jgi:acylphosphatase